MKIFNHWRISSFQVIVFTFGLVILLGCLILCLPISALEGESITFSEALFTATSAVCVTGLVVRDTATTWSVFGQTVIMVLIQIGGIGVVTVGTLIAMGARRKIGLIQRSIMQNSISAPSVGGILELTMFIIKFTLIIEALGTIAMMPVFIGESGVVEGVRKAMFHSISAFCNAGFDLSGGFNSLTKYQSNVTINVTIGILIIAGGLGFFVWNDIKEKKWHFSRYALQTKIVLIVTAILLAGGFFWFYYFENDTMPESSRAIAAMFQSVTLRTAGFNSVDMTKISESGQLLMIVFMLIGGSPGSTAGGIKTTTAAVMVALALSVFRRNNEAILMKRSLRTETVRAAATILMIYVLLFTVSGMIISRLERLPLLTCMFETTSAIGTVGLSMGITPSLGIVSRMILIVLMFSGRVGGLTLIYAAISGGAKRARYPEEDITVG